MEAEALRVLMIEDDQDDARLIEWYVGESEEVSVELEQVQRLTAGLNLLANRPFDALLLDLGLPESIGLDTLREVRRLHPNIPIVVLTGLSLAEVAVEAMKAGADDYLIKGQFDRRQLMRAIHYAVERTARRRAEDELRATNQALRRMAAELTMAEQQERRRLARLLHESLQQLLAAAKFKIEALRRRAAGVSFDSPLGEIEGLLGRCIEESRALTQELSPPVLYDAGLAVALGWLSRHVQQRYGLCLELNLDPQADPEAEEIRVLVFQAVRELLLNVSRHAQVSCAKVITTKAGPRQLQVEVLDGGVGFDSSAHDVSGLGGNPLLFSLRERLEALGGCLEIRSTPGQGTRAVILAPLDY